MDADWSDAARPFATDATMPREDVPLTELLQLAAQGERAALDNVFTALYPELRKIAHARLRTQGDVATLDTTSLVHESFLRLVDAAQLALVDRKHFFTYAAKTMRNIIIDFAREHFAERRGGGHADLRLDTALANEMQEVDGDATLIRVHDALLALEAVDPELARVVEMRYFAGYSEIEVAELMGTSERTVRRQWDKARAFLLASLRE
ncbi:MAG: ECF-type sigma factor [Burkholderiaceae bacterium]|nr:ECF-type sigma factor [Burkholderiaceae bacterium]